MPIPQLEQGERLTRPEFERRPDATPHFKKAELIDGVVYVAPERVADVASSSMNYDLDAKLDVSRRTGVKDYPVYRVRDRAGEWFGAREVRFVRLAPGADGLYRSGVFPGPWLDAGSLIRDDRSARLGVWRQGTACAERAAFIPRLTAAAPGG